MLTLVWGKTFAFEAAFRSLSLAQAAHSFGSFIPIFDIFIFHRDLGFNPRAKMGILPRYASLIRPPYSFLAQKVVYGQFCGLAETGGS